MIDRKTMYERVLQLCKEEGITVEEFGQITGIGSRYVVHKAFTRNQKIKFEELMIVAGMFDVSLDYLFGRTDCKRVMTTRDEKILNGISMIKDVLECPY